MKEESPIRLLIGLGNPGKEYARTRHNVGFMILDRLAGERGANWTGEKKWKAEVARRDDVIFAKPQTFMNLSGEAVAALAGFYKIAPESILVVYDDVDLPLGRLRFRLSGTAGGHNGVRSMIQHLGTDRLPRLKFGIGRELPGGDSMTGHVLGTFGEDESESVEKSLARAQDAVNYALARGLGAAMNRFNSDPDQPAKTQSETQPNQTEEIAGDLPADELD